MDALSLVQISFVWKVINFENKALKYQKKTGILLVFFYYIKKCNFFNLIVSSINLYWFIGLSSDKMDDMKKLK